MTEVFFRNAEAKPPRVACRCCASKSTTKVISQVSFKIAKPAKYGDDFLHHARRFLRTQKETAEYFAEGRGSEDSKTFKLAEQIGERIDQTLATQVPSGKSR